MRFLALLLVLGLACGDDDKTDASVPADTGADVADAAASDPADDVALDVAPDTYDGGPDTQDAFETPNWRHQPRIEVHDMTPCEEWDYVERTPRGLPADSTPRVLWRYRPSLDPLYSIHAQNQSLVQHPVVSPDGTIWVHGPRPSHVTQLTREGRIRRWWFVGGTNGFDPDNPSRLGPLVTLPDGRAIAVVYSEDPVFTRGYLMRIDPTRPFRPAASRDDDGRVRIDELDINTQLAVGPGGMVYAAAGHRLHATCKGERLMWTLTNESSPGEPDGTGRLLGPVVEADGTLQVSGMERLYRIAPNTTEVSFSQPVDLAPGEFIAIGAHTPSLKLASIAGNTTTYRVALLGLEDIVEYEDIVSGVGLSPTLQIVFGQAVQAWFVDPPYSSMREVLDNRYDFTARWLEAGHWVGPTRTIRGLSRVTIAGDIVWSVDPAEGDAGISEPEPVLDQQGVFYASMMVVGNPIELVAIQTDGLPAPLSMCVDQACNAFRDRWMRTEEVEE